MPTRQRTPTDPHTPDLADRVRELEAAIAAHKDAKLRWGLPRTPTDEALWAVVDDAPASTRPA